MKCEYCNYQTRPDNLGKLVTHLESACTEEAKTAVLVWRNSQITATAEAVEGEHIIQVEIKSLPAAEGAMSVAPVIKPNVTQGSTVELSKEPRND